MDKLPTGWAPARFADLGEIRLGKMLDKARNTGVPAQYLRNVNVRWFRFDLEDLHTIHLSEEEREALSIRDGDLLICEGGEPGRAAVWRGGPNSLTFQKALHRMRVAPGIEPELVMYRLRADAEAGRLREAFTGTTIRHLTGESLARYPISVPPASEQVRLVQKITLVLTRVDACRERLERVPQILKKFREAVLEAAVSGRLTEDWRNGARVHWDPVLLGDLFQAKPRNGYSPKSVEHPTNVMSLTLTATTSGRFQGQHFKYIDERIPADSHLWLHPGDILIQRANTIEYVGVSAIYDGPPARYIYPDLMMKCRANNRVSTSFLHILLQSAGVRGFFRQHATGTAGNMPKINQQTVMAPPVLLPPSDEQSEIVRRVDKLFSSVDGLYRQYSAALSCVERFTPSVLAKAFRGELVPQDPKDEPAGKMLERLAATRSSRPLNGAKATQAARR